MLIDHHVAVGADLDTRLVEVEGVGIRHSPRSEQQLLGLEEVLDPVIIGGAHAHTERGRLDRGQVLAKPKHHPTAQQLREPLGHVVIERAQQVVTAVQHGHLGAERREDVRELRCDQPAADDDQRFRQSLQSHD